MYLASFMILYHDQKMHNYQHLHNL